MRVQFVPSCWIFSENWPMSLFACTCCGKLLRDFIGSCRLRLGMRRKGEYVKIIYSSFRDHVDHLIHPYLYDSARVSVARF